MSTVTITVTEGADRHAVTIDRDPNSTPAEVMGLIVHGMVDAAATVILADAEMGPTLRTIQPDPGKTAEATARSLARGMAVAALKGALPSVLAGEQS